MTQQTPTPPSEAGKRYEIKQLTDILAIPEDRLDAFLPELKIWYQQVHTWKELIGAATGALGIPHAFEVATEGMTWIDDDKGEIRIKIGAMEEHHNG